jgi:hypothetical protein
MKAFAFLSILVLGSAVFAQLQPGPQYSIFDRNRNLASGRPPGPGTRPGTQPAIFVPIFIGVIKEDTGGYVGFLENQSDVTPLKIGDTLAYNHLTIVDLNLSRMLLSNNTSIPLGNDLLNRPHPLPTAPLLAAANPATPAPTPSGRTGRRGNFSFGNGSPFSTNPNQPNPNGPTRGRGGFGTSGFGRGTPATAPAAPAPTIPAAQ